jgi:hypothetical protein
MAKRRRFIINHRRKTMKKHIITLTAAAFAAMAIISTSCGGSKPSTPQQASAAGTGRVKIEKDECQVKGHGEINRASGTASGVNESLTLDRALLDARTKLATQYGAMINGLISSFDEEFAKKNQGQEGGALHQGETKRVQNSYVERLLTNTKTICENMYAETNGNYTAYVTVEAGEQDAGVVYDQLKKDDILSIEYDRAKFMEEFEKAKSDYRNKQ